MGSHNIAQEEFDHWKETDAYYYNPFVKDLIVRMELSQSTNLAKIKELEETVKDRESHATFLQEKRNELQTECDNRLAKIKELEAEIERLNNVLNQWSKDYTGL